jgi:hypothetical protein
MDCWTYTRTRDDQYVVTIDTTEMEKNNLKDTEKLTRSGLVAVDGLTRLLGRPPLINCLRESETGSLSLSSLFGFVLCVCISLSFISLPLSSSSHRFRPRN